MNIEEKKIVNLKVYKIDHEKLSNRGKRGDVFRDILHLALLELEHYETMFDEKTKEIAKLEAKKRMERWIKRVEKQ